MDAASLIAAIAQPNSVANGGNIFIQTGNLQILNGSEISVSDLGAGDAGNLRISAKEILLSNQGRISAQSASGEGGNIQLEVQDLLLMRNRSDISTTAGLAGSRGNGGNISIQAQNIVALDRSLITAQAFEGQGGNIRVVARGVFLSPDSFISASTQLGIAGTVEVNQLEQPPEAGLVALPATVEDISGLVDPTCAGLRGRTPSEFYVTGRGGVPESPDQPMVEHSLLQDLGTPVATHEGNRAGRPISFPSITQPQSEQIVAAQGWVINSQGNVVLTSTPYPATDGNPWLTSVVCLH
ncbi:hypothetical protein DO97_20065 [Neosynechococcus sphagnicola sy1]|uniref:Filamentous haemagglutinin FhaB/tRNA nuclease CdiA-like TPS domain-containing protein n=1 Tax=Neosynechococcus sphagnicola sy1 TaxID=1497020 RepID=A0A098TRG6_9CYAN|nr:S-layer family protein [Neosynechococcus sphagnicola]KGF73388.1 hypothetical protein DO97_20065 [Neosynechococcus sphagnicola sy1]